MHWTRREGSIVSLLATLGLIACAETPTAVRPGDAGEAPRFATTITAYTPYTPPQDSSGAYLLAKACDVLIGEPAPEPGDPAPTKYAHQLLVSVPAGATIRLVNDTSIALPQGITHDVMLDGQGQPAAGGTVFGCDARDPDDPTQPVVDPATAHVAKGNGPEIHTAGVTLDLDGYGVRSWISATSLDPAQENIGIVVAGDGAMVTNGSAVAADGVTGVSVVSGFGHNLDVEAPSATLLGLRLDHDQDTLTAPVYNLVAGGAVSVRRSGTVLVDGIRSVDPDPLEGVAIELRDCGVGDTTTVRNSHLESSGEEAVFIRECSGVVIEDNFVSAANGNGIATREATSTTSDPIIFRNNTIRGTGLSGIVWGRDSRNVAGLTIAGNTIEDYGECGIMVATDDPDPGITPALLAAWEATNFFEPAATDRTCVELDD